MATQSVKIPVELELKSLQSSIGTLEKALGQVKPNTKIYNNLSQQLERVKRDFLSLQVDAEKSYSKIGEVQGFERNFEKVADKIQILARSMASLEFENLNFDASDLQSIGKLEEAIANIKKEISNVKIDAFKNLFSGSSELQETFKDLHLNINTDSAEQAIKKITQELDSLDRNRKKIERSKISNTEEISKIDQQIKDLENFKNLITNLDDTTFFRKNKTFKNKKVFVEEWSKRLGLDAESLNALVANGAKNMAAAYDKIEEEVINKTGAAKKRKGTLEERTRTQQANLDEITRKENLYSSSLKSLQEIGVDPAVASELDRLQQKLRTTEAELEEVKNELTALKGPSTATKNVIKETGESFSGLPQKISASVQQLERYNETSRKIGDMQHAIKQWFGFNEVINLSKRTISDAISHIRELDKVMTEIAVVTDMDQDDLWGQIDTYSKIAQDYGVTTVGVYEVSQLFYQQGKVW